MSFFTGVKAIEPKTSIRCLYSQYFWIEFYRDKGKELTEERGERLSSLEKIRGGNGIVSARIYWDFDEGFTERIKPCSTRWERSISWYRHIEVYQWPPLY